MLNYSAAQYKWHYTKNEVISMLLYTLLFITTYKPSTIATHKASHKARTSLVWPDCFFFFLIG